MVRKRIPYVVDGQSVMICSPVGNQSKFVKIKADIVLSGFCTAPDAAISYLQCTEDNAECRNTFNTTTMRRGISRILQTVGFKDAEDFVSSSINPLGTSEMPTLFLTQTLCMISKNGQSKASGVWESLKNSDIIRNQAEGSLAGWYRKIKSCLDEDGLLLIMGNNAMTLLGSTYLDEDRLRIDMVNDHKIAGKTLLDELSKNYSVFQVIHAAGIRWKANETAWLASDARKQINNLLRAKYPEGVGPISLTPL